MADLLDAATLSRKVADLDGWSGDPTGIRRSAQLPSFRAAIDVVNQVAEVAEQMDHHPDIDIRWRTVTFACATHSAGGVTTADLELAARIDDLVRAASG